MEKRKSKKVQTRRKDFVSNAQTISMRSSIRGRAIIQCLGLKRQRMKSSCSGPPRSASAIAMTCRWICVWRTTRPGFSSSTDELWRPRCGPSCINAPQSFCRCFQFVVCDHRIYKYQASSPVLAAPFPPLCLHDNVWRIYNPHRE